MPLYLLDDTEETWFPPVEEALPDGLLAIGGTLTEQRLLSAYAQGIFPWYDDETPLWWCPDPRFVLFPDKLKVSKSMRQLLRRNTFEFTVNRAFADVIAACAGMERKDQDGTWITDDVAKAYTDLHQSGYAHSAEVWQEGRLVGGLYGIRLGNVFYGESMFSRVSNASKYAFIRYVELLQNEGVQLIDCQIYTKHLESLGAEMIPRAEFTELLRLHHGLI